MLAFRTSERWRAALLLAMDDPVDTRDENTYWIGFSDRYDVSLWQNPVPSTGTVYDYTHFHSNARAAGSNRTGGLKAAAGCAQHGQNLIG